MENNIDLLANNDQTKYILNDIIFKTFTANDRFFNLLFNLNRHMFNLNKKTETPIFKQCLLFFNFNQLFLNNKFNKKNIPISELKLTFSDNLNLKSSFKKAFRLHDWELSKNDKLYNYVYNYASKYVEVFTDMIKYIQEFNVSSK